MGAGVRGTLISALVLLASFPPGAQVTFTRTDANLSIDIVTSTYGPNWADCDGDGDEDIFNGNHGDATQLLRNNGGASFTDILPGSGIPYEFTDRHGAAWGDMDNDGLPDLYVSIGAESGTGVGYNQLYHNLDGAHFTDISPTAGTTDPTGRGRSVTWADFNCDGWLDLLVTNYVTPNRLFLNRGDYTFQSSPHAGGLEEEGLRHSSLTAYDGDTYLDVLLSDPWNGLALFRNAGDGGFIDISAAARLPRNLDWIWSVAWLDFDNDGDEDLYLSRGYVPSLKDAFLLESDLLLFQTYMPIWGEDGIDGLTIAGNCTGMRFKIKLNSWVDREKIFLGPAGVHPNEDRFVMLDGQYIGAPSFTPGVDVGTYIWQDSVGGPWELRTLTDFSNLNRYWAKADPHYGTLTGVTDHDFEPISGLDVSDRLYRNQGNGTFYDFSTYAGIGDDLSGKNCVIADFDNDGWQDIYVVNDRRLDGTSAENAPNLLYMNNGDLTFTESAAGAGIRCEVSGTGAAAAWADYNDDGFPDLYVVNGWDAWPFYDGPQVVYRNNGNSNHWVKLRLIGTVSNRDAIGARVRLFCGDLVQYRVQTAGQVDMAQSTKDVHFGLGQETVIDSVTIWWPSGQCETFAGLAADQTYVIAEGCSAAPEDHRGAAILHFSEPIPNPSHHVTAFYYELPRADEVRLEIFDLSGRLVRLLQAGEQAAGPHTVRWDGLAEGGCSIAPGIYFARLRAGGESLERRIVRIN